MVLQALRHFTPSALLFRVNQHFEKRAFEVDDAVRNELGALVPDSLIVFGSVAAT